MTDKSRKSSFGLCASLLVLVVGVVVLWRGLSMSRPPTSIRGSRVTTESIASDTDGSPLLINSIKLSDIVNEASLPDTLDALSGRVLQEAEGVALSPRRAEDLAAEARDLFEYILSGSLEGRVAFYESRGGVRIGPEADPSRAEKADAFSQKLLGAFRMQPVSLEQVLVRRRTDGQPAEKLAPEESQGYMRGRYPALASVVSHDESGYLVTGETYEIILPIRQSFGDTVSVVLLGIWMTWVPAEHRWLPTKFSTYGNGGILICPPL